MSIFGIASLAAALALVLGGPARGAAHAAPGSGKSAAHAALADAADLPATPPRLPLQAADEARSAQSGRAFGGRGDAARRAHEQAEVHAADQANAARTEAASRAAQVSAAAAIGNANADARAAAGQARAATAKANGAAHGQGGRP